MGVFFKPYQSEVCCICGSPNDLTGEHKIKASVLRNIFGSDKMVIGNFDDGQSPRPAQGPKSKAFHFNSRICAPCNGTHTQSADREFSKFHLEVLALHGGCNSLESVFEMERYAIGSVACLNVFRYFAKLLCCHIAESGGPRPIALGAFAEGIADRNIVLLHIDIDPTYEEYAKLAGGHQAGGHQYAAHGGLIVPIDRKTKNPTSFRSSITLGPIRYIFYMRFSPIVSLAIKIYHREFWKKCEAAFRERVANPLSEDQRRRLGV